MLKTGTGTLGLVFGVMGVAFLIPAVILGRLWLTSDQPNRSYDCPSSDGSGMATCYEGETANMVLTIVFGSLALILLAICGYALTSGIRALWYRRRLVAEGRRVSGRVVAVTPTGTQIGGRPQYHVAVEAESGGAPVKAFERTLDPPQEGSQVVVAYFVGEETRARIVAPDEGRSLTGLEAPA